jgi:hypothetical protein
MGEIFSPFCKGGQERRRLDSRWSLPSNVLVGGGNDREMKKMNTAFAKGDNFMSDNGAKRRSEI